MYGSHNRAVNAQELLSPYPAHWHHLAKLTIKLFVGCADELVHHLFEVNLKSIMVLVSFDYNKRFCKGFG